MNKLDQLIKEIEAAIPKQEIINLKVSKSSVGWHIEHMLLTINLIIEAVKKTDPKKYKWAFNLKRTIVFTINKIPRGSAKAPKGVLPQKYDTASLRTHVAGTHGKLKEISTYKPGHFFVHPYFGNLNVKQTIRFLEIHTKHHLNIIQDILK